jgi:hypothetical protein
MKETSEQVTCDGGDSQKEVNASLFEIKPLIDTVKYLKGARKTCYLPADSATLD